MILVLNAAPQGGVGKEIDEWRSASKSNNIISRYIIAALTASRTGIRVPQIEVAINGAYSKSTIIKCLKEGIRLGLLKTEKGRYFGTNKLFDSAFYRCFVKLRHPDLIALSRFVININEMYDMSATTADMEKDSEYMGDHKTLYEEIIDGSYDGDLEQLEDDEFRVPLIPTP